MKYFFRNLLYAFLTLEVRRFRKKSDFFFVTRSNVDPDFLEVRFFIHLQELKYQYKMRQFPGKLDILKFTWKEKKENISELFNGNDTYLYFSSNIRIKNEKNVTTKVYLKKKVFPSYI